jgi:hypothetical protein
MKKMNVRGKLGLLNETSKEVYDNLSSGEMFAYGGGLPSGVSQSYMITEALGNPAQHFAKGGGVADNVEYMKDMMKSLYTYGGIERGSYGFNKYLLKYEDILGKKLFDKTYNEELKNLQEYEIEQNTFTDSDGLTYNSLKRKMATGGGVNDDYELFLKLKNSLKSNQRGANESKLLGYTMYEKNGEYEITRKIGGNEVDVTHLFKKFFPYKSKKIMATGGDLFVNYDEQPEELAEIVDYYMNKFDEGDYDYEDSENFLNEVEAIGYTFDYGMDNEPYNLRLIETDMPDYTQMENNYANGGFMDGVYADGGKIRRFNRQEQMDSETREEVLDIVSDPELSGYLTNCVYGLFDGYDYSETENFQKDMAKLKSKDMNLYNRLNKLYQKIDMYKFEKYDNYAKGGGVRRKNGQTYDYGRFWTKDHNEFDKGADHEVNYRR